MRHPSELMRPMRDRAASSTNRDRREFAKLPFVVSREVIGPEESPPAGRGMNRTTNGRVVMQLPPHHLAMSAGPPRAGAASRSSVVRMRRANLAVSGGEARGSPRFGSRSSSSTPMNTRAHSWRKEPSRIRFVDAYVELVR